MSGLYLVYANSDTSGTWSSVFKSTVNMGEINAYKIFAGRLSSMESVISLGSDLPENTPHLSYKDQSVYV
jgi:hypothetical protein